jgi:hypothetical protein
MMSDWRPDADLFGLIAAYFRDHPDPDAAELAMKTWLAGQVGLRSRRRNTVRTRRTAEAARYPESGKAPAAGSSPSSEPWLTTKQAAKYLGYKEKTLSNWRTEKVGPRYYGRRHLIRYRRSDLDHWLEAGQRDSLPSWDNDGR